MYKVKPMALSFYQLLYALQSVHNWHKPDMDRLHDVWKMGAPTPDSRLLDEKHYDPRKVQAGNVEKRLILPVPFATWFQDVCERKGLHMEARQGYEALRTIARAQKQVSYERKAL